MKQLAVRGFDKDFQRRLRDVAKTRGVSLKQAARPIPLAMRILSEAELAAMEHECAPTLADVIAAA